MKLISTAESDIYISVIVPSLNSVQYLRECMESILAQTLRQIEILCVDAGSTDGTLELLEEYASHDFRVRILKSEKRSYGHQVNLGIQAARGNYIGIVETDDYIAPSMYESLYAGAADNQFPDFVRGGFTMFACDGQQRYFWENPRNHEEADYGHVITLKKDREKGVAEMCHIWAAIYRRGLFLEKDIRLNETAGASYQDMSFSLLAGLLADTVVYVKDSYYYYRMDNEGSSAKSAAKWRCVVDEFKYAIGEFTRRGKYSGEIKRLVRLNHLESYFWNAKRLPQKEREIFLVEIQQEMSEYIQNNEYYASLPDVDKEYARMLSDGVALDRFLTEYKAGARTVEKVITLIKNHEKFVLAGAGRWSEIFISFQNDMKVNFIEAVADNSIIRQGSQWHQYTILSMEEAVNRYDECWFIAANKFHAAEILQQLVDLGVQRNRVLVIQNMVTENEFIGLFLNKAIHN